MRSTVLAALIAACAPASGSATLAQNFPERPLRLVVGQGLGSATDAVARLVAVRWGASIGQNIVVDNRPGVGETIAAETVARAPADGHTLLFGSIASHGIAPAIYKTRYDPARDFAPLSLVATVPNVLVVYPGLPVKRFEDFLAYVRANPGRLNYGSTGVGTSTHLSMELLKARMSLDIVHVPYKLAGIAFADLIAGQVAAALFNLPSQIGYIRDKRVRALAVTSLKRNVHLPDVPTLDESGVAGYDVVVWYAVFAPAGISPARHARLHAELAKAINSTELRQELTKVGADAVISTSKELAEHSRIEIKRWTKVVREAGISLY
jgi:tripartite-type tricarboxylate transporter receptor subunit TctC